MLIAGLLVILEHLLTLLQMYFFYTGKLKFASEIQKSL